MAKRVKCVDNSQFPELEVGKIYVVLDEIMYPNGDNRYHIKDLQGYAIRVSRFVEVAVDTETTAPTATRDDRLLDFFKQVGTGMCACNMPKDQCDYHRGG